ncbi:lysophospholipase L1-like esterase [Algoriphagus ratkowskyi]|uniref:Lysophospholipase L1-like esterase n=1 Tax=Algoriphagus ratkowskyi TaxID=57028 RepID=A0A2W7REP0_9BACT|nr:SGNH/GDSL hydrolase family protein [Algoriphagus ratkowskyi]PZX56850.1 lysophospholipase L1-like esterase [Algoriphagus ratkowskyi]TXD79765.1 SGNH/GDSL hydrolase family protein [Algoriphagus ratkowskyi]
MNKYLLVSFLIFLVFLSAFSIRKPAILIIGDSISIGYTPFVKKHFEGKAIITHNPGNAQHTGTGLDKIEEWLGDEDWDIIQFNWGLWDLAYRHPDAKAYGNRDKINGTVTYSVAEYAANLDSLITSIKSKTDAKLIFVTTSYVPGEEAGRITSDVKNYNKAAKLVMKKHGVEVNDIYKKSVKIHQKYGVGNDDVHYTADGYEKLSKLISSYLEKELK